MNRSNLTLVTAMFDIKRGDLKPGFQRTFDHYIETFRRLLKTELPLVIFCDEDVEKIVWEERISENTQVIRKTLDDLRAFPFFEQINNLRQREDWRTRAGWIIDSPQSQLELYNPLIMSKQFFLNDASIFNYFDTKYFLWIDGGIANTIGDPCNYFTLDFSRKIIKHMNKMMYLAFPYDGQVEIHGFEKKAFNEFAGKETDRVARGGMFGGSKYAINEINDIYYQLLASTLGSGYMGTEESIFTLITYLHPQLCNLVWIESNGLIIKALEDIKNSITIPKAERLAVYALTFNIPAQFRMWAESFKNALPREFSTTKKYVINNSLDSDVDEEYQQLFKEFEFEEFKKDNIGICGGRQFAAEHFAESDHEYMVFFEDDMLFHQKEKQGMCKSGLTTHHQQLFDKAIDILEAEDLDFLKLCFSEFYGDNHQNWAWYNVPQEKKDLYFPPKEDGTDCKATIVYRTGVHRQLSYAIGEYHYCNWPILFTKAGNQKVFLDDIYEHLYEQTWMSLTMNLIREGKIKIGILLASPINHERKYHYPKEKRRENAHYTN